MSVASASVSADRQGFLRQVLMADGIVSGVCGLAFALAAGPLADLLGLSSLFLRVVGLGLLPYAAFVAYVATRPAIPRRLAWMVVGLNLAWALDSVVLLLTGWVDPTGAGVALVIAQALMVATVADLQYLGLRRAR